MSDSEPTLSVAEARDRADNARLRFIASLQGTRQRIMPTRLKDDAMNLVQDKIEATKHGARQAIRKHPIISFAAVASVLAVLFWRPARLATLYGLRGVELIWFNRHLWQTPKDKQTQHGRQQKQQKQPKKQ